MAYNFKDFTAKIDDTKEWLKREYTGIRTGQASPAILDSIKVDSYGTMVPMNQVGSVTIEGAKSLYITPWDASQIKAIEKAITMADLGISVGSDEKGVRVTFPELTSERRDQMKKLVGSKLEDARVAMRHERDAVWNDIQKKQKDGEMSEDDKFRAKDEMEKIVQDAGKELQEIAANKEKELEA